MTCEASTFFYTFKQFEQLRNYLFLEGLLEYPLQRQRIDILQPFLFMYDFHLFWCCFVYVIIYFIYISTFVCLKL